MSTTLAAVTLGECGELQASRSKIDCCSIRIQVALSSIDSIDVGKNEIVNEAKNRNLWFTGIGIAGPAITGGAMLLLNKVAMALFIGLGPMFILCLLFEQTKQLFSKWLFYGIGTMFSLALLSVMVAIAAERHIRRSAAMAAPVLRGKGAGVETTTIRQGMAGNPAGCRA